MRKERIFLTTSASEYAKLLKEKKIPYKREAYPHSTKITTKDCVYIFGKDFNKDVLPIFTKIKFNILKHKEHNDKKLSKIPVPVFYITGKILEKMKEGDVERFSNTINIDIKKAYPSCLLLNKFIDQPTYDYLLGKDKLTVLKSIGVLGTNTLYNSFNGKTDTIPKIKRKPYLADVLKFIQYEIGRIMVKISNYYKKKNQFLFFWTDGIYLTPDSDISYAKKCLEDLNYKYEVIILHEFEIKKYRGKIDELLNIKFQKKKGDKPKEFNIPEKKLSMYKEW